MKQHTKFIFKHLPRPHRALVGVMSLGLVFGVSNIGVASAHRPSASSASAAANVQLAALIAAHFKEHPGPFTHTTLRFKEPLPHQASRHQFEPGLPDTPVGRLQAELRTKLQAVRNSATNYPIMTPDKVQEEYQLMAEYSRKIKDAEKASGAKRGHS